MLSYLTNDQIYALTDAILTGGLNTPDARDNLLMGINRSYIATLPLRRTTIDQIRSDLNDMNGVPYLIGGEVPLKTWLENAVHLLRSSFRPEQALFQEALNQVAAQSEAVLAQAEDLPHPQAEREQLEQIIHQDDLLAFGWLQGAIKVGRSVARISVPRYENGNRVFNPDSTQPVLYRGTGWLIGAQYIITNHHVINARSEGEPDASEADLRKQAENAVAQFDFDSEGLDGEQAAVEDLAAWHNRYATPPLDFAILKLKTPSTRTPLTLAPGAVKQAAKGILPANIIQHPQGNSKALGVRNNLVSSLEEWELRYFTDTMQGSSGAPVCNDAWQVIALHRATKYLNVKLNFQGKPTAWVNRGVRIDKLIAHLQSEYPALWGEIKANVITG